MRLEPRQITAAADQLDRSLRIFSGAASERIPWLLDRRSTADAARALLGDASDWAASAAHELRDVPDGPLVDARSAAEQFGTWVDGLRDGSTGQLRRGLAYPDAPVGDARRAAQTLREVGDGLAITDPATFRTNVQQLLARNGPSRGASDVHAATVLADARPELLGELAPFARSAGARDHQYERFSKLVAAYDGDLSKLWREYLVHGSEVAQPAGRLRDAFEVVAGRVHPTPADALPTWLAEAPADRTILLTRDQRAELALRATARTREDALAHVLDVLAVPERDLNDPLLAHLRAAQSLPEALRVDVLSPRSTELLRARADQQHVITDEIRRSLHDDLATILSTHPDQLSRQVERLRGGYANPGNVQLLARLGRIDPALVVGEASAARPWVGRVFDAADTLAPSGDDSGHLVRAWDLLRETGGDRAKLVERLAEIGAAADHDRTRDQVHLLRAIAKLPDEAVPDAFADLWPRLEIQLGTRGEPYGWNLPDTGPARLAATIGTIADAEAAAARGEVTRAGARRELDAVLDAIDGTQPTDEQLATLRRIDALPRELRPSMALDGERPFLQSQLERTSIASALDVARLLRDADRFAAEPGATATRTLEELSALLDRPDDAITIGDLRRIISLANAPDEVSAWRGRRPGISLNNGLGSSAGIGRVGVDPARQAPLSLNARLELDRLRIAALRSRIAMDPSTTPASVRAQLRAIADTPRHEVTPDQVRLLAALDGLPEDVRYQLPGMGGRRLADYHGAEVPAGTDVIWPVAMLRRSLDATEAAEAAGHTRADLTGELRGLLIDSNDRMPQESWTRILDIASVRADLRPDLPSLVREDSAAWGANTAGYRSGLSNTWIDRIRVDAYASGLPTVDEIATHVRRADGSIDLERLAPAMLARVTSANDAELSRIGLDRFDLIANALDPSRGSGKYHTVATAIMGAHPLVEQLVPTSPTEAQLIETLRTLLDDNLARVQGKLRGGYSTHPDYAQHGRTIATFDTLRALRRIEARASEQAAATTGAAAGEIAW